MIGTWSVVYPYLVIFLHLFPTVIDKNDKSFFFHCFAVLFFKLLDPVIIIVTFVINALSNPVLFSRVIVNVTIVLCDYILQNGQLAWVHIHVVRNLFLFNAVNLNH